MLFKNAPRFSQISKADMLKLGSPGLLPSAQDGNGGEWKPAGIKLKSLLNDAEFLHANDWDVRSCCGKSQECQPEDLYVALVSSSQDGHNEVEAAITKGATAVVVERRLPLDIPQCVVSDSRVAYGKICHALAGNPSRHLKTIAVAGTDGKSTTAELIYQILAAAGKESTKPGPLAEQASELNAPCVAQAMADAVMGGQQYHILECSSRDLAQRHFAGAELDVAVFTNLRGAHFDFHRTMANYQRSQLRLLEHLRPQGLAILNADDPTSHFLIDEVDVPTLTFGIRQEADVRAQLVEKHGLDQVFILTAGSESVTIRSQIPGQHHIYNCLAAAAVGLAQGIDLEKIARGIECIQRLPGRMESVQCGQDFQVIIDESASPYRLGVALNTLKHETKGRVICVLTADAQLPHDVAGQMGRVAERSGCLPIVTMNNVGTVIDYEPSHRVLDGFERAHRAQLIPDRIRAIEWALAQAGPHDTVLISGQGAQPFQTMGNNQWQLTDRDVCEAWLYGTEPENGEVNAEPEPPIYKIDDYRWR